MMLYLQVYVKKISNTLMTAQFYQSNALHSEFKWNVRLSSCIYKFI